MLKQELIEQRIENNYWEIMDEWITEWEAIEQLEKKTIEELQELLSD